MTFKEGDYFYSHGQDDNGDFVYSITRCLKLDEEHGIAHVTMFQPLLGKPTESDIDDLEPFILHIPIQADGFGDIVTFGNRPVTKDDLDGYFSYLKMVDFQAYLDETGADVDLITRRAEKLFDEATALADDGKFAEAAEIYYECYQEFPLYVEALDNAALCLMDVEEFEQAAEYFIESIEANDNTFMTDFNIGVCYQELGEKEAAREWFTQAQEIPDLTQEQKDALEQALKEL